jgi:hypothetical protein
LKEWVTNHDLEEPIIEYDMFLRQIQKLLVNSDSLTRKILTRWFASSDLRLVEEARMVLSELKIQEFSSNEINSMHPKLVIYVTEKLLAGNFESTQIMWLCTSIMQNTSKLESLQDYFSRVLSYLGWNYPGGALGVFDEILQGDTDQVLTSLLQGARNELEQQRDARRKIHDLFFEELAPSEQRNRSYWGFESKKMQRASEKAMNSDRFPLQKMLTKVSIGRGNRSFHMNIFHPDITLQRTFDAPRGFSQFSESFELPRGEILDPEGETWRRIQRRNLLPEDIEWKEI